MSSRLAELPTERESTIGSFLWGTQSRVLAIVPLLRRAGGTLECRFGGGSMRPAIPSPSRLRIGFAGEPRCGVGCVIAYMAGDTVMVHRVVYRGRWRGARGHLILCGDRLVIPDLPVDERWILGSILAVQKDGVWSPPGPSYRPLPARIAAFILSRLTGALLEIDVRLARHFVRACDRVRLAVLPKRSR